MRGGLFKGGANMPKQNEDPRLTTQIESIHERIRRLEIQVNRLIESPAFQGREFVVVDDRNRPRARFEVAGHSPQVILLDSTGRERLRIGLHTDGTPSMWVEGQEIPLVIPESRGRGRRMRQNLPDKKS